MNNKIDNTWSTIQRVGISLCISQSLLLSRTFAFLSTLMSYELSQVTSTWIDIEDEIYRDLRAVVQITDRSNTYYIVIVSGKAVEQTNPGVDEHIDKLAK